MREQIARLEGRLRDLLRPRYQQIDQMENVDKLVSAMQKQGENVEKLMDSEAIARK